MDNRSHDEAKWDYELLAPELEELKELDFGLDLTGFDSFEIEPILAAEWAPGTPSGNLEDHQRSDGGLTIVITGEQKGVIETAVAMLRERENNTKLGIGPALVSICEAYLAHAAVGLPS